MVPAWNWTDPGVASGQDFHWGFGSNLLVLSPTKI